MLADKLGRKRVILLADTAFIAGALIQAISASVWMMVVGRAIVGLAVGAGSFVVPLYIAELAPAPFRGRLVTLNILFVTVGQVVAYVIGWIFVQWGDESTGWRWIVGLGALPAVVQLVVMLFMPETPRWLVMLGRRDEARSVLNKVFGMGTEVRQIVDGVLKNIEKEVQEEDEAKRGRARGQKKKATPSWMSDVQDTWGELLKIDGNRRALTIACLLQGLQQLCGFVGCSVQLIQLTTDLQTEEFPDVLFSHHISDPRFFKSNTDLPFGGPYKLFNDLLGFTVDRSRWKEENITMVGTYNVFGTVLLKSWLSLHKPNQRRQ